MKWEINKENDFAEVVLDSIDSKIVIEKFGSALWLKVRDKSIRLKSATLESATREAEILLIETAKKLIEEIQRRTEHDTKL